MELHFGPRGILQIDDARIIFRNFSGRADKYNREGDRNFALIIPTQELAEELQADTNEFGVGWKVKIKEPREEGDTPFIYLPVNVKFNGRGPKVVLISGNKKTELDEESVSILDDIDIACVDMDIRPYDGESTYGPFRSAYLQTMYVTQEIDRLGRKYEDYGQEV